MDMIASCGVTVAARGRSVLSPYPGCELSKPNVYDTHVSQSPPAWFSSLTVSGSPSNRKVGLLRRKLSAKRRSTSSPSSDEQVASASRDAMARAIPAIARLTLLLGSL